MHNPDGATKVCGLEPFRAENTGPHKKFKCVIYHLICHVNKPLEILTKLSCVEFVQSDSEHKSFTILQDNTLYCPSVTSAKLSSGNVQASGYLHNPDGATKVYGLEPLRAENIVALEKLKCVIYVI